MDKVSPDLKELGISYISLVAETPQYLLGSYGKLERSLFIGNIFHKNRLLRGKGGAIRVLGEILVNIS